MVIYLQLIRINGLTWINSNLDMKRQSQTLNGVIHPLWDQSWSTLVKRLQDLSYYAMRRYDMFIYGVT